MWEQVTAYAHETVNLDDRGVILFSKTLVEFPSVTVNKVVSVPCVAFESGQLIVMNKSHTNPE